MKKSVMNFVLLGAMALTGAWGLAACSSSDHVGEEPNPNYDPETNTVNTQFVFNVSTAQSATTRMSDKNVQSDGSFRGMENVHIQAFKLSGTTIPHVHTNTVEADHDYDLGSLLKSDEITAENARRVVELALPVGSNAMMFYGKAPKTGTSAVQGAIDFKVDKDPAKTAFSLKSRLTNTEAWDQSCDMLATIMTRIAQNGLHQETQGVNGNNVTRDLSYDFWWPVTYVLDETTGAYTIKSDKPQKLNGSNELEDVPESELSGKEANGSTYTSNYGTYTHYVGSCEWYEYGDKYKNNDHMAPLGEILGSAYHSFTTINTDEIRAGSAGAILRLVNDLYTVTKKVKDAEPTNAEEHIAKLLGGRIFTRFSTYFDISNNNVTYKSVGDIKNAIETYVNGKTSDSYAAVTSITEFPTNLGLPMGAAQMIYDESNHQFSYSSKVTLPGLGDEGTGIDRYMYPAELCYFGNSPLRVSEKTHATIDYPATVAKWNTGSEWGSDWTANATVHSNTRSVAMMNNINYGTALLETTVRFGSGKIYDNNKAINTTEDNNEIDAVADLFTLTGVIVGGQPNTVGWNYIYRAYKNGDDVNVVPSDNGYNRMVFDNTMNGNGQMPAYNASGAKTTPNYTLVWDNYTAVESGQQSVYVALEFKNNGKDFWGKGNLVRAGGTFYLIGKLDPTAKDSDDNPKFTFPSRTDGYQLPPYDDSTGNTVQAVRVFIQDYKTTADFVIGESSLQNAYVTVPDLRASQISLGLSVDLNWETGLNFSDIVLGQ